ncbi:MAG: hypothetical protein CM1200mP5_5890 [Candidatus Pelagibacterales bacterium]|nr:MAG: hypothetical protein CM1200mP5_5890 [Pelagibacterales bacterium]
MTTREMVNVIRGLSGMNLISADVVEVSQLMTMLKLHLWEQQQLFMN